MGLVRRRTQHITQNVAEKLMDVYTILESYVAPPFKESTKP